MYKNIVDMHQCKLTIILLDGYIGNFLLNYMITIY